MARGIACISFDDRDEACNVRTTAVVGARTNGRRRCRVIRGGSGASGKRTGPAGLGPRMALFLRGVVHVKITAVVIMGVLALVPGHAVQAHRTPPVVPLLNDISPTQGLGGAGVRLLDTAADLVHAAATDAPDQEVEGRFPFMSMGIHHVPLFPSASNPVTRQGFIRFINRSGIPGKVRIDAFNDAGERHGPVTLHLGAGRTVHLNSRDLEEGNRDKGLDGATGPSGKGDWRLTFRSALDLAVLAYVRTYDGFLTSVHALAPRTDSLHRVAMFNPGENVYQMSMLRLVNPGKELATVSVEGTDDRGESPGSAVQLSLEGGASRTLTAQALESGQGAGLRGALGDGTGKWRLTVTSDRPVWVMNLLSSPTGHLTNLSTVPDPVESDDGVTTHDVPLLPAASRFVREEPQGFVRVVNHSDEAGEAVIDAFDDAGARYGPVTLQIGAGEAVHFTSGDLEEGNLDKGLDGSTGPPNEGDWRLSVSSSRELDVLSYVRDYGGFLASMHELARTGDAGHRVDIFNPGGNRNQVSRLRLVNPGMQAAEVTIEGIDDEGDSPGSTVALTVPAGGSRTFTAQELESGDGDGLRGALSDGAGKWQLVVTSDQPVLVMNLLSSPAGHLTNLSTGPVERIQGPDPIYRIIGEQLGSEAGWRMADIDCDGADDLLIESPRFVNVRLGYLPAMLGRVYLLSGTDMRTADAADGELDQSISLQFVSNQPHSWTISGTYSRTGKTQLASMEDGDGDGCGELVLAHSNYWGYDRGSVFVFPTTSLSAADEADGASDRSLDLYYSSLELRGGARGDRAGSSISTADMDADGRTEVVISAPGVGEDDNGAIYIISAGAMQEAVRLGATARSLPQFARQTNSWTLIGAAHERNTGEWLATGDFDGDGRADLLVHAESKTGTERDVLYVISATDLMPADAADGSRDGRINLAAIAEQENSWRLTTSLRARQDPVESILAAHDLDGDGTDEIGYSGMPNVDGKGTITFISLATLRSLSPDGGRFIRDVSLANLQRAAGWVRIRGGTNRLTVWSGRDLNGDDVPEILIGEPEYMDPANDIDPSRSSSNGAVYILSGRTLDVADAADGTNDSTIDLGRTPVGTESWRIIGGPGDELGSRSRYIGDLDGDGFLEVGFGANLAGKESERCPKSTPEGRPIREGGAVLLSTRYLSGLDADDGAADRDIHLGMPGEGAETKDIQGLVSVPRATRQFGDNIIIMEMTGSIKRDTIDFTEVAKAVIASYGDRFDLLLPASNIPSVDCNLKYNFYGIYSHVQNHVRGVGLPVGEFYIYRETYGPGTRGRLKGMIFFPYRNGLVSGPGLHEIAHMWANFVVPTKDPSHWGFSSAYGQLGGFDIANLVSHGNGRYSAGRFGTNANWGNSVPYSPIELYFAGLIGPEEVPDLWVARDGSWTNDQDAAGNWIFHAPKVETYTIDRIVAEHGARGPDHRMSQKKFRAALVLLVDDLFPEEADELKALSEAVERFARAGDDGSNLYNFWEATGGRATLEMGGLEMLK